MIPTLSATQGDDRSILIELSLPVSEIAALWITAKGDPADPDPGLFQLSTAAGTIVCGAAESQTAVGTLAGALTKNLPPGRYFLECQAQRTSGQIETAASYFLVLKPEITRAI